MVRSMNLGKTSCPTSTLVCEACTETKYYVVKWDNDTERQAIKPLDIVHSDVYGPMMNMSMGGAKYFVTFVDDFLMKVNVYIMKSKGKWFERLKEFGAFVKMQLEHEIKAFRWMSGGDSILKEIDFFL